MTEKEFTAKWKDQIGKEMLKSFPDDFISGDNVDTLNLPGKSLTISELFNSYEVLDAEGNTYFTTDDYVHAKYVLYSTRLRPKEIVIPKNLDELKAAVKDYKKLLDKILKEMGAEFKTEFPESDKFMKVSNIVFNSLNLQRY